MKQIILLISFILLCQASFGQVATENNIDSTVYAFVDQPARYPGGTVALLKYMSNNLKFDDKCSYTDSRIVLRFVVEKDGCLSGYRFLRPVCEEWKDKILNIMNEMPRWIPASNKGRAVRCEYKLPVSVFLKK